MNPYNNNSPVSTFPVNNLPTASSTNKRAPKNSMWGGKPFKGKQMNIRNSDPERNKPQLVLSAPQAKVFNMEDEKEVEKYQEVMHRSLKQEIQVTVKEIMTHRQPLAIYLEWYDTFYTDPETARK
jgi:hypothetical protein